MPNSKIIMIPYAFIPEMSTGANIKKLRKQQSTYLKNCTVALISAKKHNKNDTDVALVTNIKLDEEYEKILKKNDILIIEQDFDIFRFKNDYKWGLAFYKLCALYHISRNFNYSFISYLDSDVYVRSDFKDIWKECEYNILMYDINHGLHIKDYKDFVKDVSKFNKDTSNSLITQYGGEFYASNRQIAIEFSKKCLDIFQQMILNSFVTRFGDEFIISIAVQQFKVKNAGAYIWRYWTRSFRLISTNYKFNPVIVLHLPDEKEDGFLKLYKKYIKKGKLPSDKQLFSILHLSHLSFLERLKKIVKYFIRK